MSREENVINYYVICNKLKNTIRKGWMDWNVQNGRIESVAEHIFSTQMLAIAMYSEYHYDIDITRVIMMLAIHELGECIIGDLTMFDITREEKEIIEHQAVKQILKDLDLGNMIEELFLEFDFHRTKEALFAYECDKLECDLQSKIYDEQGLVDLNSQENNSRMQNERVKDLLNKGYSWSKMWMESGLQNYPYDENFKGVSTYAMNNTIMKKN